MGLASLAFSADDVGQTPPCMEPQEQIDCPMMPDMGDLNRCTVPPMGQGYHMGAPYGRGQMHGPMMHKEIRDRMDALREDVKTLSDLWVAAVLARGDKSISTVREEFSKTNAELIARIEKAGKSIKEDVAAIREGFDKRVNECLQSAGKVSAPRFGMMAGKPNPEVMSKIDADIVESIRALKNPLTVEEFEAIRDGAVEKYRAAIDAANGDRFLPNMPFGMGMHEGLHGRMQPMDPALSRMRDQMHNMRGERLNDRREMRGQLREAMKIKNQAEREEALKKILDKMTNSPDDDGDEKPENE